MCVQSRLRILNGRTLGDLEGKYTFHNSLGSSTIDYIISSESFLHKIIFMKVNNLIRSLSDHCCISVSFAVNMKININPNLDLIASTYLQCPDKYIWDESSISRFQSALSSVSVNSKIKNFQNMSFENKHSFVDITLDDVNELFFGTARLSLKKKQVKKSTKRKNNKRWYDRSLQELRMSVDHYSRLLSFNPYNSHLRQKCFQLNSKYNRERKRKRRTYFQTIMNKIDDLEESNPKMFWKLLNSLKPEMKNSSDSCIDLATWHTHFKNINSIPQCQTQLVAKLNDMLKGLDSSAGNELLDKVISQREIMQSMYKS